MADEDFNPLANKPLGTMDRVILNNLFDTQPARRSAYLKKLGYEMNPKDENEYRPIGSTGGFAEIDPGIYEEFKRGGLSAAGKELLKDAGDIAYDVASGPPIAAGATLVSKLTAPGGPVLAIAGAILGGAAGNTAAEGVKKMAGDVLLDENVPIDKQGLVLQSIFTGIAPQLLKGGKTIAKEGYSAFLNMRKDAIINAAKQSGGGLSEEILNKAIKSPEMFTRESVDGATGRLKGVYKEIFGIEDPLKLDAPERISGGAFGKTMSPLNEAANAEIESLAKNPNARFELGEIEGPIKKKIFELSQKFERTPEEEAALSSLRSDISSLAKKVTPDPSAILDANGVPFKKAPRTLSFKDAREWLTAKQHEYSDKNTAGDYIHPAGRVLAPSFGGKEGVLSLLNNKAASVGSSLPEINAQRSRVLQAYNTAAETLTPTNITSAFVGADNVKKQLIQDASAEIDNVLGTKFSQAIEDGSMQRIVENLYKNPKGFGSGPGRAQVITESVKGGLKGGMGGLAVGLPTGTAPLAVPIGVAAGAVKGGYDAARMASPEAALSALRETSSKIGSITSDLTGPQSTSMPANIGGQMIGREAGSLVTPKPTPSEEFDPLGDFDPLKDFEK
jgi:hypothetical protein